jgi:serine/threonine protein kinase
VRVTAKGVISAGHFHRFINEVVYPEGLEELKRGHLREILSNELPSEEIRADYAARRIKHTMMECSLAGYTIEVKKRLRRDDRTRVYLANGMFQSKNRTVILKVYRSAEDYTDELSFLARANHPSIVRPICNHWDSAQYPALVMDFAEGVSSTQYFRALPRPKGYKAEDIKEKPHTSYVGHLASGARVEYNAAFDKEIVEIASKLYEVIRYMHWLGYSHSDLKPSHILINDVKDVYIIDFEEAVPFPLQNYHHSEPGVNGPDRFLDSDLLQENIDIWSLGSLIASWTVSRYTGDVKWSAVRMSSKALFAASLPEYFSPALRQLLYYCFNPDPYSRRFNTRAQQEFFRSLPYWEGVDWEKLKSPARREP